VTYDGFSIEGIDTEGALKRFGGKAERYKALLLKFADKQAGTVISVRAALSSGDLPTAEREVHSLKGAAASLGAIALAESAAEAENALKEASDWETSLQKLESSLVTVIAAIRAKLPS
jgi:HPt (histidine-containing phosphotransfer) domain-containing protein